MRSRNIKPGFFKNDVLAEVPVETRLLFIGLWCLADREGRLEDRPLRIKAELYPYDSFDVDSMLNQLQSNGFLLRYEVDGQRFLAISNFVKHQDPHYKEKVSEIPPPDGHENQIKATGITRSMRLLILERDGFKCKYCGATSNLSIDHILPVSKGGETIESNLQVLCMGCNTAKGNKLHSGDKKQNKKNKSGHIQKFGPNSIQGRIELGLKKVHHTPLIPDSLIPDSLIPDSLIPDSLIPDLTQSVPLSDHFMILNDGAKYQPPSNLVSEWVRLFPAVDVGQELREMEAWCIANPRKRKTKTGIVKFITSWLSREQDKGGSRSAAPQRTFDQMRVENTRRVIDEWEPGR